jgi:hypothetical protein
MTGAKITKLHAPYTLLKESSTNQPTLYPSLYLRLKAAKILFLKVIVRIAAAETFKNG